jgi:hypothetical protein
LGIADSAAMTRPAKGTPPRRRHRARTPGLRVGRRRQLAMQAVMINIFDIDIDVLVERGLLAVHRRDDRDSIAQAVQHVLGAAIPALATGALRIGR